MREISAVAMCANFLILINCNLKLKPKDISILKVHCTSWRKRMKTKKHELIKYLTLCLLIFKFLL